MLKVKRNKALSYRKSRSCFKQFPLRNFVRQSIYWLATLFRQLTISAVAYVKLVRHLSLSQIVFSAALVPEIGIMSDEASLHWSAKQQFLANMSMNDLCPLLRVEV